MTTMVVARLDDILGRGARFVMIRPRTEMKIAMS